MFDDQMPNNQGQTPSNLPVGEPEDVFSDVDKVEPVEAGAATVVPATATPQVSDSALGAGALRPVEKEVRPATEMAAPEAMPEATPEAGAQQPDLNTVEESLGIGGGTPVQPAAPPASADMYAIKEPTLTRGVVGIIIVVVAIMILSFGGWWIYNSFIRTTPEDTIFITPPADELIFPEEDELPILEEVEDAIVVVPEDLEEDLEEDLGQDILDEQILFGEPIDTDGDGLDDEREIEIGIDPNNWDTDGDELSDGDEVIIWKTEPLNPDTDGDSFFDGAEIKNGYNPAGPGKLFEPPVDEVVGEMLEDSVDTI